MRIIRPEDMTPEDFASLLARDLTPEELKEAYALANATFTAADLQKFLEICQEVPLEEVLRELEEAQQQFDQQKS